MFGFINRLKSKSIRILSIERGPIAVIFSRYPNHNFSCITTMCFFIACMSITYHCKWSVYWFFLFFKSLCIWFIDRWINGWMNWKAITTLPTLAFVYCLWICCFSFYWFYTMYDQENICCTRIQENTKINILLNTLKTLFVYLKENIYRWMI